MSEEKPMTNIELRNILYKFPDDYHVLIHDYESSRCKFVENVVTLKNHRNEYDIFIKGPEIEDAIVLEMKD